MPVLRVVSNAAATNEQKLAFVTGASSVFFEVLRVPKEHIHVMIEDGQFFAFGGDAKTPAAWVTIHASRGQILEGSRKHVVDGLMPLLKDLLGCGPERTTSFFMEVPVENIAVGDAIIQFSSPRSPQGGLANIRTL